MYNGARAPYRPERQKFRIQPWHDGRLDPVRGNHFLRTIRVGCERMARGECKLLNFTSLYNMAYKLTVWGWGNRVYDIGVDAIRRGSLWMSEAFFRKYARMVGNVAMYCERTWVVAHNAEKFMEYAHVAYKRRVAHLWRLFGKEARRAFYSVFLRRWSVAFNQVRFREGGSGWLAARESFHAHSVRVCAPKSVQVPHAS
jgi:hypothetical protein